METEKTKKPFSIICAEWSITLCDVLLFSSALNCLFQFLAYRKTFDIVLFTISLCLGLLVYFFSIGAKKSPIISKRVIVATSSVIVWAILIPVLQTTL